uniref:Uncharacterized protein n=1 Tax=Candidatus Kentrum sp. LFY TaxID=2126342 RepID=A0A450V0L3_9GAMM|nr:MAG: hypothetical protein BECKLFY1418B_GA0070995_11181 [Candidatus Kentron sp. LFY]
MFNEKYRIEMKKKPDNRISRDLLDYYNHIEDKPNIFIYSVLKRTSSSALQRMSLPPRKKPAWNLRLPRAPAGSVAWVMYQKMQERVFL